MRRFTALFVMLLSVFALVVSATAANADSPTGAAGDLYYDPPSPPSITERGQTLFIDVEIDGEVDGTLDGYIHEEYTVVHHVQAGFNTYRGVLELEGMVTDAEGVEREGRLTLLTRGRQDPGMRFPTDTPWYTRWVIVGGDGEPEQVQRHGTGELVGLQLT